MDFSDARRSVYEKARNALIGQLKAIDPPLTTSEISRQRLELEEAIRRVERELGTGYSAPPPPPPQYEPDPVDRADLEFDLDMDAPAPSQGGRRQNSAQEAFRQEVQVAERQAPAQRGGKARCAAATAERARPAGTVLQGGDSVRAPDVRSRGANMDVSDDEMSPPEPRRGKKKRGRDEDRGRDQEYGDGRAPARGSRLPSIIFTVLVIAVIGGLAALGWSQRELLSDIIASFEGSGSSSSAAPAAPPATAASTAPSTAPADTVRDVPAQTRHFRLRRVRAPRRKRKLPRLLRPRPNREWPSHGVRSSTKNHGRAGRRGRVARRIGHLEICRQRSERSGDRSRPLNPRAPAYPRAHDPEEFLLTRKCPRRIWSR